jgi:hypothetical protein
MMIVRWLRQMKKLMVKENPKMTAMVPVRAVFELVDNSKRIL